MNWKLEIGNWKWPRRGFSLMELLVTVAVILILISALIGGGSYVRTRANVDLTRGLLEELSTALEEYYNDQAPNAFPFEANTNYGLADLVGTPNGLNGTVTSGSLPLHTSAITGTDSVSSASSAALFYFLDRNPASRAIVDAVPNTLITNKDGSGVPIKIDISGIEYDLPRYIDPWKTSLRYVYLPGTAFPVLTSAGPDKVFDTPDDITSK